jgi:hypothetical protein
VRTADEALTPVDQMRVDKWIRDRLIDWRDSCWHCRKPIVVGQVWTVVSNGEVVARFASALSQRAAGSTGSRRASGHGARPERTQMKLAVGWGVSSSRLAQLLARGCPSPGPLRRACGRHTGLVGLLRLQRRLGGTLAHVGHPPRFLYPARRDSPAEAMALSPRSDSNSPRTVFWPLAAWRGRAVTEGVGLLALMFAFVVWKLIGNGADWFVLVFSARFSSSDSS